MGSAARDTRARSRESSAACSRGAGSPLPLGSLWMVARLKFLTLEFYPGGAAACTCALAASICSSACISGTLIIIMCDACVPSPPPAASAASALTPGYGTGGRAAPAAAVVDAEQQARRCSSSRALVTSPARHEALCRLRTIRVHTSDMGTGVTIESDQPIPYEVTISSHSRSPSSRPPLKTSTKVRGVVGVGRVASKKWPGSPIMSSFTPTLLQTAAKSTEREIGIPVRLSSTRSSNEFCGA
mmetsp:Transcript_32736/g.102897  ORF Transcript_32736/g.102897 Transcript_32736/m.102897 type:complete len:243 (+) Transcript_32736:79-807(+)